MVADLQSSVTRINTDLNVNEINEQETKKFMESKTFLSLTTYIKHYARQSTIQIFFSDLFIIIIGTLSITMFLK